MYYFGKENESRQSLRTTNISRAIKLFCGSWEIRANFLGLWREHVAFASKVFAIIFPGVVVGLANAPSVLKIASLSFVLSNITMMASMTFGSIFMVLILVKYVKTRRILFSHERRNGWFGSSGEVTGVSTGTDATTARANRRAVYDRALIVRFTTGFIILLVFEAVIIFFTLFSSKNFQTLAKASTPDFSTSGAITDIILFVPGVTTSLVCFLVFGTTKSFKQYKGLVFSCGKSRSFPKSKKRGVMESQHQTEQGTEFQRLSSMGNKVLSPEEQAILNAKMRGIIKADKASIGTVTTVTVGKTLPESSVEFENLSPISQRSPESSSSQRTYRGQDSRNMRNEGGPSESWTRQNEMEIGLSVQIEQQWSGDEYGDRNSVGKTTTGTTTIHGGSETASHRDFILDASD
ncbi:glycoside hydrolase protein [Rutstroemia sp. NJR-2017a WRK4]|nr:glycoside hydrolase protein [Rutstroemia sp. NJR-2017a WRK4]